MYTTHDEIYSQGNTEKEECIRFVNATPVASEDIIFQCSLSTLWKLDFLKKS